MFSQCSRIHYGTYYCSAKTRAVLTPYFKKRYYNPCGLRVVSLHLLFQRYSSSLALPGSICAALPLGARAWTCLVLYLLLSVWRIVHHCRRYEQHRFLCPLNAVLSFRQRATARSCKRSTKWWSCATTSAKVRGETVEGGGGGVRPTDGYMPPFFPALIRLWLWRRSPDTRPSALMMTVWCE